MDWFNNFFSKNNEQRASDEFMPKEFGGKLMSLLDDLQKATGTYYQITVRKHGITEDITLGSFENMRVPITVYNMTKRYESLNGNYSSFDELRLKIKTITAEAEIEVLTYSPEIVMLGKRINRLGHEYTIIGYYKFR